MVGLLERGRGQAGGALAGQQIVFGVLVGCLGVATNGSGRGSMTSWTPRKYYRRKNVSAAANNPVTSIATFLAQRQRCQVFPCKNTHDSARQLASFAPDHVPRKHPVPCICTCTPQYLMRPTRSPDLLLRIPALSTMGEVTEKTHQRQKPPFFLFLFLRSARAIYRCNLSSDFLRMHAQEKPKARYVLLLRRARLNQGSR